MTPAKGEQQESPNSLGETKEPQHSRPGKHCAGEPRQAQLLLLFQGVSVPSSVLALRCRGGICVPGSAALGGLSPFTPSVLGTPGERRRSLSSGHCGLLLGAERQRGSLQPQGQHPGDASSSFSTWVPAALASGYTERGRAGAPLGAVFPPAAQAPRAKVAAEQGHAGALAGNAAAPAPRRGSSSSPAKHKP